MNETLTMSGDWAVSADGLCQFGHSTDHRPDLPQVKVMLATRAPLGMPLAADVGGGQLADDPLYLPTIKRVQASLKQRGLLYVGDCNLSALRHRAALPQAGTHYRCPLRGVQRSPADLAALVEAAGLSRVCCSRSGA